MLEFSVKQSSMSHKIIAIFKRKVIKNTKNKNENHSKTEEKSFLNGTMQSPYINVVDKNFIFFS